MGRGWRDKVNLTGEQRENLEQISRNGYAAAKKILHARILLMCDEGEQAKSNGVAYSKKKQLGLWKTQRYCILEQDLALIWTFTTSDARVKLKHLYPVFEEEESGESIAPN